MKDALVIIDVAPYYSSVNKRIVNQCLKQIEKSILNSEYIILVEFSVDWLIPNSILTVKEITNAVSGYKKLINIDKKKIDGSKYIHKVFKHRKIYPRLKLMGVEADVCVQSTALGLNKLGYNISVIRNGINACTKYRLKDAIDTMRDSGISII